MRIARNDKSLLAEWWFTIDRPLLVAMLALIGVGCLVSLAASPAVAQRIGLGAYHFTSRHAVFALLAAPLMVVLSFLTPAQIRRLALGVFAAMAAAAVLALLTGPEINGAKRWLLFAGQQFQPTEFLKPAFTVLISWLLAQTALRADVPALPIAAGVYLVTATLLVLQPDIGQTALLTAVAASIYFLSGAPLRRMLIVVAAILVAAGVAYATFDHVRNRVDRFTNASKGDTYQMDQARKSIVEGGLLGKGPGEGQLKLSLPDAHTDYVLAVIAEEYGALACLGLVALYAGIALRALALAARQSDLFLRFAGTGLTLLFAFQTLINTGVAAGLLPAKGMTLPFLSYGGSSSLGVATTLGMLLAVTRARPKAITLAPDDGDVTRLGDSRPRAALV